MQILPVRPSSFSLLMVGLMLLIFATPVMAQPVSPSGLTLLNADDITQFKTRYLPAGIEWRGVARTFQQAPGWISADPVVSVISKTDVAPSGDKRDYLSYGIYVWQKPSNIIYRDGNINRANFARDDRLALEKLVRQLRTLSLSYALTNNADTAAATAARLRAWFLSPETGMQPNLTYAEMQGRKNGTGWTKGWWGFQQGRSLLAALDAAVLIEGSPSWSAADTARLRQWFADYTNWAKASPSAGQAANSTNNHYSWYVVQMAELYTATNQPDDARVMLRRYLSEKLLAQVNETGVQPIEIERPDGLTYSTSNLFAMLRVAELADRLNAWPDDNGTARARIVAAYKYLRPSLRNPKAWPHSQSQHIGWQLRQQAILTAASSLNRADWLTDLATLPPEAKTCASGMWLSTGAFRLIPTDQRNVCQSLMRRPATKPVPAQSAVSGTGVVSGTVPVTPSAGGTVPEGVSTSASSVLKPNSPDSPVQGPSSVVEVSPSNLGRK